MKNQIAIKYVVKLGLVLFFLLCGTNNTKTIYAATLQYYDVSSNSFLTYSGNQVKYTYNDFAIPLSHPGILINGTALADYKELFVNELGLTAYQAGNEILLSNENTTVLLSINSKTAWVNGTEQTMSVAPVMLYTGEEIRYYVPTRFLAETFGFDYLWISSSSTVKISKTISYTINGNVVNYNNGFYKINYNDNLIPTDMPVISYNGNVIIPLQQVSGAIGCNYIEDNQYITISKAGLTVILDKYSKITYLNNKKIIADDIPLQIKDNSTGRQKTYASLEFVAQMLGFETVYDSISKVYSLTETGNPGIYSPYFYTENSGSDTRIYYEWISENINNNLSEDILTKVRAYSEQNYDVVELYGVSSTDINGFFDNGMIILELNNIVNALGTQFFSEYFSNHLNYTLLTEVNDNTRFFFMAGPEDKWKIIEEDSCVKVIFYNNVIEPVDTVTQTKYPDDKLIIPLEEYVKFSDISDKDNYLERNFEISIKGNHLAFFENNLIYNPYYNVINSEIKYDALVDKTIVKIFTKNICAYTYSLQSGYLAVSVGRPKEFYSKIIVLDAGHGGIDPGASKSGINEKDLNFKILNTFTKDLFASSDIKVYFTRETDVKIDLYERAAFAEKVNADMFISLHMNANNSSSIKGTEVYYSSENNNTFDTGFNSALLAKTLVNNISTAINTKNRGATKSDFVVTKYNSVPAVLIELGYMTNASELEKLRNAEYQKKTAEAIYNTVKDLFTCYFLR